MPRKKKIPRNDLGIPEYEMESLARILLPIVQTYLASEEGKRDYAEWKERKHDSVHNATDKETTE